MSYRNTRAAGFVLALVCLLAPPAAQATVKCQCNNGTIAHAMNADYGDEDAEEECNDACSTAGGGRVWNVDTDSNDTDVTVDDRHRMPPARPRPRR
jgi:hypothetical protein